MKPKQKGVRRKYPIKKEIVFIDRKKELKRKICRKNILNKKEN